MIRTRFAPSPTGYMHIGNLRTALYAYLLAKSGGGKFILRIEDTDRERYVEGSMDVIFSVLNETGLIPDEGPLPFAGGEFGPYIQSERRHIYAEYARELIDSGHAYYCFCNKDRLDAMRKRQELAKVPPKYDRHCLSLSADEVKAKLDAGEPWVIRQNMPQEGKTVFTDEVFGEISTPNEILDDNVLLKSDGLPTYNFANVVDDHLMGITHVIRGSEYLSSTPKYNLLYEAFGWDIPTYIHCSPVMRDASHKLSKREGDASYEDYLAKGYLKEAIINYIALLGWSPGNENEKYTLDELIKEFNVSGISKSPAIFDENKLKWLNGEYIRAMSGDVFHSHAAKLYDGIITNKAIDLRKVSDLLHKRCERLSDIPEQIDFFDSVPDYDLGLYVNKKMKTDEAISLESLKQTVPVLSDIEEWSEENIHDALIGAAQERGVKNGVVMYPLRVALSGKAFTPGGGVELSAILGKAETINRINAAIDKLDS